MVIFYILFGFLCAQVSAVYCVPMGREKFAILSLKPRSRKWAITLRLGDFK